MEEMEIEVSETIEYARDDFEEGSAWREVGKSITTTKRPGIPVARLEKVTGELLEIKGGHSDRVVAFWAVIGAAVGALCVYFL